MMHALYRAATTLGEPLIRLYLKRRMKRGKEDTLRFNERLGHPSKIRDEGRWIWMHGASVGESLSLIPLIDDILKRNSEWRILVTTGTVTAAHLLEERLPTRAVCQYVPVDRLAYVRRFLDYWRPDLALWAESELWPNLTLETHARKIPMVLLNGRMSERSFKRWQRQPGFIKKLLGAFDLVLAQSTRDQHHFQALGAPDVRMTGNLKSAAAPLPANEQELAHLRDAIGTRPVWLAASTHPGEETIIVHAHQLLCEKYPDALTFIVPRHPERGPDMQRAISTLTKSGDEVIPLRSKAEPINKRTQFYIADTLGELGIFYRLASIVLIGKSLIGGGGQNPMEPALLDCALLFGPDMSNFEDIAEQMIGAGGAQTIHDGATLGTALAALFDNKDERNRMAAAAQHTAKAQADVITRINESLAPMLERIEGTSDASA